MTTGQVAEIERLWTRLRDGGYVLLMRHGRTDATPTDAPGGITIGDCSTQRMLSQAGRNDAVRLGEVFKRRAIPVERIVTSEFCRAQDTARMGLEPLAKQKTSAWDRLNFLAYLKDQSLQSLKSKYTAEVRDFISRYTGAGNLVMVTHSYNTDPILVDTPGVELAEGEFAVLRPLATGKFEYLGRIPVAGW